MEISNGGERSWRAYGAVLAVAGTLALVGCGGDKEANKPDSEVPKTAAADLASDPSSTTDVLKIPTLVFDDLGGGSNLIQVYPGAGEATPDRQSNGTFSDGDVVPAECKTVGRTVNSVTDLGEEPRTSDQWIRIQGSPGVEQYATAVYIENPETLLQKLPDC